MSESNIRLIIVDDHPLFREGVARTLADEPDIDVVGECSSAEEANQLTDRLEPDIVLLDIDIPGSGMSVIRHVVSHLNTRIIILTASEDEDHVVTALKSGAHGYALKGVSARELADIIRAVRSGRGYVPPELAAHLLSGMVGTLPKSSPQTTPLDDLTEREMQILDLVAAGASNKEIASKLNLAEKTVKSYMTSIMQKLQVRNRVEAALMMRSGDAGPRKLQES